VTSENPENPVHGDKSEPRAERKASEQTNDSKPEVPLTTAQPQAAPSPHHCEITCKTKRDWVDKAPLGLEGFGLFVLIVYAIATIEYACITNKMWKEMQEQTRIQRDTSINSERAWVGLDTPVTLDAIETQSARVAIKGHYSFKNFGHGPAVKVIQSGNFIQQTNLEMEKREADFYCNSSVKFATGTVPVGGEMKQPPPFGYTLFPNQGHDESIDYQGGIDTLKFLQFIGCVAYIDQFKTVHWTRFCMQRRPGDTAKIPKLDFCSLYNDTDQPKEK
jgi:hypothetical protein